MSNTIDALIEKKIKELEKHIDEIAYKEIKPMLDDELKKSVLKNIYGRPESEYYDRTNAMYDSIKTYTTKPSKDKVDVISYMDLEHTSPRHISWVSGTTESNGMTVDQHLDYWMEYGHGGLVNYEGSLSFTEARYNAEKKLKKIVKKELKKRGYKKISE